LIVCNRTGSEQTLDFWKAPSLVVSNGERLLAHTSDRSAILTVDWNFGSMMPQSAGFRTAYVAA
jgi:N-carbamoylputrescine amidase